MRRRLSSGTTMNALSIGVYAFLLAPLVVVVVASFNSADFHSFPPAALHAVVPRLVGERDVG
jgi:ABC-type spermidine/putrescine transport system permease subunit II